MSYTPAQLAAAVRNRVAASRAESGDAPYKHEIDVLLLLGEVLGGITSISGTAGGTSSGSPTHINNKIDVGGTAKTLLAATAKVFWYVRNTSAGDLRITYDGSTPSSTNGQLLKTGEGWENPPHWCPQGAIKIWGATTDQTYEAIYA